jgi:hypothetical protein
MLGNNTPDMYTVNLGTDDTIPKCTIVVLDTTYLCTQGT